MSKWDVPKRTRKPRTAPTQPSELSRVLPPRVARVPEVLEWLLRRMNTRPTNRIAFELRRRYRELAELLKSEKFDC